MVNVKRVVPVIGSRLAPAAARMGPVDPAFESTGGMGLAVIGEQRC